ncbi:MAG: tRNA (cytidine(34)-2'-O)-methyltransferase [Pyrinomonadaceae bacterium]
MHVHFTVCFHLAYYHQMLHVALFEPEIHPNTGNIARICAATRTELHIVGVTGFKLDEKSIKRAGLDYWGHVNIQRHIELEDLYKTLPNSRFIYFTTKSTKTVFEFGFKADDCLVFGPETRGLPDAVLRKNTENAVTIPMPNSNVRSLNLATSVGIAVYQALFGN